MKEEKDLLGYMDKISQNEIEKLRKSCRNNKILNDYLFKESKKIFKKILFPYFRFEIILRCMTDIINNNKKYYPKIEAKRFNIIYHKLQKICLHLNIALEEYSSMLSHIATK